jgi:predicted small secreted protein
MLELVKHIRVHPKPRMKTIGASMLAEENAMKLLTCLLVLISPIMLGACNTVRGFGQDLSAAGGSLSSAADTIWAGHAPAVTQLPAPAQGSSVMPQSLSTEPRAPGEPAEPK